MAENGKPLRLSGAPYPSRTAGVGGLPTIDVDVPITAVFMVIYLCSAAANMFMFRKNRKRNHKFIVSAMLFVFCMGRVFTCIVRMIWATREHNVKVAVAAQISNDAGVLIVYLINMIFVQRVLRAKHPKLGWNTALAHAFHVLYALLIVALIMTIAATVVLYNTINEDTIQICIDCQRIAAIFFFILATIPLLLVLASFLLPQPRTGEEFFGVGSTNGKAALLMVVAFLATIISGFKLATTWRPPRPIDEPAWYHSRAAFYCFGYMLEIFILGVYIFGRVDKRFHVPNGSGRWRSYMMTELVD